MHSTLRRRQCRHFLSPGNTSHFILSFLHSWPVLLVSKPSFFLWIFLVYIYIYIYMML